jgi:hypothetical protein
MKKAVLLITVIVLFCLCSLPVFSEEIVLRPKDQDMWEMCNLSGDSVGTLKRTEAGNFGFYDKGGKYIGVILQSGTWIPWNARKRKTVIKPEEAQLYVDVLRAIKTIK